MVVDQTSVLAKISSYLSKQNRSLHLLPGYCNGFTLAWLYYVSIDQEANYFTTLNQILFTSNTSHSSTMRIEELLNAITWLQLQHALLPNHNQSSFDQAFEIIKPSIETEKIGKEFEFSFLLTRAEIIFLLEQILSPNKMIYLARPNHAMGMIFKNGQYIFYDCNDYNGQKSFKALEDVIDQYIAIYSDKYDNSKKYYAFTVIVYDYISKQKTTYPKPLILIRHLLANRGNIDVQDITGVTSLWTAAQNNLLDIARSLLARGVTVNMADDSGYTELHVACANGHFKMVQLLVENKCDTSLLAKKNKSILHCGVRSGNVDLVSYLLSLGLDVNLPDNKGRTPLHLAARFGFDAIILALIRHGADLYRCDHAGKTPLYSALYYSQEHCARQLLANGVDINWVNVDKETLLHQCAYENQRAATRFLLAHGINIRAKDCHNYTALHLAVVVSQKDILVELLKDVKDPRLMTELIDLANQRFVLSNEVKFQEIVQLLEQHKAALQPNISFSLFARSRKLFQQEISRLAFGVVSHP